MGGKKHPTDNGSIVATTWLFFEGERGRRREGRVSVFPLPPPPTPPVLPSLDDFSLSNTAIPAVVVVVVVLMLMLLVAPVLLPLLLLPGVDTFRGVGIAAFPPPFSPPFSNPLSSPGFCAETARGLGLEGGRTAPPVPPVLSVVTGLLLWTRFNKMANAYKFAVHAREERQRGDIERHRREESHWLGVGGKKTICYVCCFVEGVCWCRKRVYLSLK